MRHLCRRKRGGSPDCGRCQRTADVQYKQIVSDAEKRSEALLEKTNQDMEKERDRALQSVQKEISTLAMAAAIKIIGENSSKVTDEQLYNEFLSKTGDKHDSNNG